MLLKDVLNELSEMKKHFEYLEKIVINTTKYESSDREVLEDWLKDGYLLVCVTEPTSVSLKYENGKLLGYYFGEGWEEMNWRVLNGNLWRRVCNIKETE